MTAIHHNVDMVRQERSPVCWLACAVMLLQYERRYTPSTSDLDIYDMEFRSGSVPSTDGNASMYQRMRQLGFTVVRRRNINGGQMPTMAASGRPQRRESPGDSDVEMIVWLLRNRGPFILNHFVGSFWYGPNVQVPEGHQAHAVVVTGIDTNRGTVYFNNPWGTRDVPTSIRSIIGAIQRWEADDDSNQSLMYL